ncbi:prephenate dehydrogenase [Candidatus Kinetoplastidibacterium crithidiae]|uniref:Prephenate dehydrogenase n=1 Tax=Candidatus Kinetoplastidibacterium crithidiae TCC036E TaxID=1208918 RepID=M1LQ05_9PROT|nr:prephenate dehydrogenase/arogenate dehydrogenase family protein [Candidatus Kinetoplastibacterium crithidii]AFZ82627.1 prephenate dehydrogenase [Candidatus Kinetoplastibacterium crithidii (ex Angomonas deanei ATCC 30255)]AGF47712.1 prephenate dehydrogenase [Candidatus Kinetoplastibacterium crithidii TCC036E]
MNNKNDVLFKNCDVSILSIIGVGLIGSSFALALRRSGYNGRIIGVDNNQESLIRAKELKIIDDHGSLEFAVSRANFIMLATPVGHVRDLLLKIKPNLLPDAIITDVGSTKMDTINAAYDVLDDCVCQFIPGHPIAGIEKTGPDAATAELFNQQNVVITPLIENRKIDLDIISNFWLCCGANVMYMSPEEHDSIFASVSHLPHFLSYMYMSQVASSENCDRRLSLAGSGFRDFSRISASSPDMWCDIFFSNKKFIEIELEKVLSLILMARKALDTKDRKLLYSILEKASIARRNWFKE